MPTAARSTARARGSGALFSAEAGIGFKTADSSADSRSVVSRGSTLQAGGNLNLTSTQGDIHVVQGNLSAANTVSLDSARDILLEAGQAHLQDKSRSSNAGAEVGVGISVGAQTGVRVRRSECGQQQVQLGQHDLAEHHVDRSEHLAEG